MLPRKRRSYELCDSFSQDLEAFSTRLFTHRVRPRVASLKKVMILKHIPLYKYEMSKEPILYITDFEIPVEYCSTSSTVGPLVMHQLFKKNHNECSVAIKIPCCEYQFTVEGIISLLHKYGLHADSHLED